MDVWLDDYKPCQNLYLQHILIEIYPNPGTIIVMEANMCFRRLNTSATIIVMDVMVKDWVVQRGNAGSSLESSHFMQKA